mmetsp:Transcript_58563/g.67644  ORF Transcript_58563/g.67644 Transcript_58563/m.67644 type:complete len:328 (+) Transcript_58563:52-1035(+)
MSSNKANKMEEELPYEEELKKLEDKITEARENFGDVEVRDAILDKAHFYLRKNQKDLAVKAYEEALGKTIGVSKKLEVVFYLQQIYLEEKNLEKLSEQIDRSKKLLEEGGDWERKNKLKVYEGLYFIMVRKFKEAANLFLESTPTFNAPEVISFDSLVFYTVLTSMVSLDRADIRKKVIHSPDILSVINGHPTLKVFLESFYKCDYKSFFASFLGIIQQIQDDPYLKIHKKYFVREMRVVIYSQFLESYKTVTLKNMADAFGVSVEFIDKELSEFIATRRLSCKIDKISGIVESDKADKRNNLYLDALKKGDVLLNKLQKLSRIIDI